MTVIDQPSQIAQFRLLTLRKMLELEIYGMTRKGASAYSIIKKELGLKGNKKSVLEQLNLLLNK